MNPNETLTLQEEKTISLRDLFWYILHQWKRVLILAVVFALLLGIYQGYSTYKKMQAQNKEDSGQTVNTNTPASSMEGAPAIVIQPKSVSAAAGGMATFSVVTTGPVAKYQWQYSRDGMAWSNLSTGTYPTAATEKLMFTVLSTQNNYVFRCTVTFTDEQSISSEGALLTVTDSGAASAKKLAMRDVILNAVKYAVLGAILGFVVGAFLFSLEFVGKGYFANEAAVTGRYGRPSFGIYPSASYKGLARKIMNRMTYRGNISQEESAALIAANLKMASREGQPLLLTGTVAEKDLEKVKKALEPHFETEIQLAGNVNNQAGAVDLLAKGDHQVVCVEKLLGSRQTYMDFEMQTIARSASGCAGFILIE